LKILRHAKHSASQNPRQILNFCAPPKTRPPRIRPPRPTPIFQSKIKPNIPKQAQN